MRRPQIECQEVDNLADLTVAIGTIQAETNEWMRDLVKYFTIARFIEVVKFKSLLTLFTLTVIRNELVPNFTKTVKPLAQCIRVQFPAHT